MGNITALGNAPGANPAIETYSYDPLYRLLGLKDAQGQAIETYTYNKTGDRLSKASNGLATGTYGYQAGTHWLTNIGSSARTYDANGNTTGNGTGGDTFGYGYNDRNRMTVVQRNGQTVANYTYNAMGQRVAKAAAVNQRFAYDEGSQLIGEYGATSRSYVWLGELPVAVVDTNGIASTVSYVHADGLGTPRSVTDAAGVITWQWSNQVNPLGEKLPAGSAMGLNLRFAGQYIDVESGMYYNIHRDYDSSTGRYIQSDPVGLRAAPSTYAYVGGNPQRYIDPLGLFLWPWESPVMINGGTPQEQAQVIAAVNQVFSTPRGQEMLEKIEGPWYAHGNPQTLNINDYGGDNAIARSNEFSINPDANVWVQGAGGRFQLSLPAIISHEMGHALMGDLDDGPCNMNNTIRNENPIEHALGLPVRTVY